MTQSRRHSVVEVTSNTAIGMVGSWLITLAVLESVTDKVAATTIDVILCTVWSLVRGYAVRRHFASRSEKQS